MARSWPEVVAQNGACFGAAVDVGSLSGGTRPAGAAAPSRMPGAPQHLAAYANANPSIFARLCGV
jgi:hypothetical protein